ncbi:hypothetical protein K438DRAFT_1753881 [Mycena galopus ATCC 62051]|nr:hypothetical protein K438DRAFT_1753881 [Mycena galopus ATCC 62051]
MSANIVVASDKGTSAYWVKPSLGSRVFALHDLRFDSGLGARKEEPNWVLSRAFGTLSEYLQISERKLERRTAQKPDQKQNQNKFTHQVAKTYNKGQIHYHYKGAPNERRLLSSLIPTGAAEAVFACGPSPKLDIAIRHRHDILINIPNKVVYSTPHPVTNPLDVS